MRTCLFLAFCFMWVNFSLAADLDRPLKEVLETWEQIEFSDECCQKTSKIIDFSTASGLSSVAAIQLVFPDEKDMLAPVEFIAPDTDTIYDFLFANVLRGDKTLGDLVDGSGFFAERKIKRALEEIVTENESAYPEKVYEILNFNGSGKYSQTSAIALVHAKTKVGLVIYVKGSK